MAVALPLPREESNVSQLYVEAILLAISVKHVSLRCQQLYPLPKIQRFKGLATFYLWSIDSIPAKMMRNGRKSAVGDG